MSIPPTAPHPRQSQEHDDADVHRRYMLLGCLLGWAVLALACYPHLWDKSGERLFKLDAWVYYHAVAQWHAGGSLYDWWANPEQHLWPFTYTPFAATLFTPLTWIDDRSAQVLLTLATPVSVAVTIWACARHLGWHSAHAWTVAPWGALTSMVLLEPVSKTMEYGQINALLMMLVVLDCLVIPRHWRGRGLLCAVAAAIKLTPAIAVVFFLARRQWRAAATMTGGAIALTAVCALLWPAESLRFFFSTMWDPSRAGFADYSGNQNLTGLIARGLPKPLWTPAWAVSCLCVVSGAWLLMRAYERALSRSRSRRQDAIWDTVALSITMTCGLLISPISWSHHWVWCAPMLGTLTLAAYHWRLAALGIATVSGAAVFALGMQWWFPEQNHVEQAWPWWADVLGSSYTLWAIAAGIVLACSVRTVRHRSTLPRTVNHTRACP